MRARLTVFIMVLTVILARPWAAAAESDMLSWLDGLSGPGPFHSRIPAVAGHDVKILCRSARGHNYGLFARRFDGGAATLPCLTNSNEIKWYLSAHYDYLTTGDKRVFSEPTARTINAHVLEAVARWRLHPSVDLGIAGGWTLLTDGRDPAGTPATFPLVSSVTVTPVSLLVRPGEWFVDNRWTRAVAVRFNEAIRLGHVTSADFGGAPGAFDRGTEANARVAVTVDFAVLAFSK